MPFLRITIKTYDMRKGETKYIPIIGNKYGQWTIISTEIKKNSPHRNIYWKVKCKCGKESWRSAEYLVNGRTNSCKSCAKSPFTENSFLLNYTNRIKERAKKKNLEYNLTDDYLLDLLRIQNYKCALSNISINLSREWRKKQQTASLDRIDNLLGYVKNNVQWVHKDINFMKSTYPQDYFIDLCKKVVENYSKCG